MVEFSESKEATFAQVFFGLVSSRNVITQKNTLPRPEMSVRGELHEHSGVSDFILFFHKNHKNVNMSAA